MQLPRILATLCIGATIVTLLVWAISPGPAIGQSQTDIIQFYWQRAGASFAGYHPDSSGLNYALRTTTFYRHVNRKGAITSTDTTRAVFHYSWGKLDSVVALGKAGVATKKIDLSYPDVFRNRYRLNFFPNDTGGSALAIGFANDSAKSSNPTGLLIINRNHYFLEWLYLYYPNAAGYKRYTRSFRFARQDNFVFPDSVWEVGSIAGIFTKEYYRVETSIDSVIIMR